MNQGKHDYKKKLLSSPFYPIIFLGCDHLHQAKNTNYAENFNGYKLVENWPVLPKQYKLGNPTGIGIDINNNIVIFQRAAREWRFAGSMQDTFISAKTILILERNSGKIIDSWGDQLFIMPHGLTVDISNNIWVTDVGLHQVFKFSHDGKLLMKLGEAKVPGDDSAHFNLPTDVAVAKDGSFYVSDGYGNSRIIHFSAAGRYLFAWGKKGNKEGEFNVPHAVDLDNEGNVYVADRENKRIQVFSPAGKFIKQFVDKSFERISSVTFNKVTKKLVAVDDAVSWFALKHYGSDIILFDSSGNFTGKFGKTSFEKQGIKCWYHDVAVDNQQNIYVTDILGNRIQKFKKISRSH